MNMPILTQNTGQATYREKLLAQKIQLLEIALKANLQNPSLDNCSLVAKAKFDLLVFMRGEG